MNQIIKHKVNTMAEVAPRQTNDCLHSPLPILTRRDGYLLLFNTHLMHKPLCNDSNDDEGLVRSGESIIAVLPDEVKLI